MRRRGFTYTELLCVIGIVAIMWMLLLPSAVRARNRADDARCSANLRNISWALAMYAQDHNGRFPPKLTDLTPRYLHVADVYLCPRVVAAEKRFPREARVAPEGEPHYAYRPGLAHDDLPQEAIVWDRGSWHRDQANVLYLSGAVTRLEPAELDHLNEVLGASPPAGGDAP
jgi:competence protein ComGC